MLAVFFVKRIFLITNGYLRFYIISKIIHIYG